VSLITLAPSSPSDGQLRRPAQQYKGETSNTTSKAIRCTSGSGYLGCVIVRQNDIASIAPGDAIEGMPAENTRRQDDPSLRLRFPAVGFRSLRKFHAQRETGKRIIPTRPERPQPQPRFPADIARPRETQARPDRALSYGAPGAESFCAGVGTVLLLEKEKEPGRLQ